MSICKKGIGCKIMGKEVSIKVEDHDPLIKLANMLPWETLYEVVEPDLKQTAKGCWNRGRKLKVRIHLGVFLLQKIHNYTDRNTEYLIKNNAAFQIFCGRHIVDNWNCPDHTKIESFRSRLKPETQRTLANLMTQVATDFGFADPSHFDIDSTVQEANITYPTDAKMLKKLAGLASRVIKAVSNLSEEASELTIDMKTIAKNARAYFFKSRQASHDEKTAILKTLWESVETPVKETIAVCKQLPCDVMESLSWNVKRAMSQLQEKGQKYLDDALTYVETSKAVAGKALSFHAEAVGCFTKGKDHKKYEFGRAFQLARIAGNFLFVGECHNIVMNDKESISTMLETHQEIFPSTPMESVAADKGYYSKTNIKNAMALGCQKVGLQKPHHAKYEDPRLTEEDKTQLADRRSGIEPLIGHAKQGGQLGRSRMKSDESTLSAGYASVMGFNLRQLKRAVTSMGMVF